VTQRQQLLSMVAHREMAKTDQVLNSIKLCLEVITITNRGIFIL